MKKRAMLGLCLLALVCLFSACALAENELMLPQKLRTIKEKAFYGDQSLDVVEIPENVRWIESKAFADSSLKAVYMPDVDMVIADDAFDGCEGLVMYGYEGSYAERYAQYHEVDFHTIYKASPKEDFEFYKGWINIIISYVGNEEVVVIPSRYGGSSLRIKENAFSGCESIKKVVISDGVDLDKNVFVNCPNLETVILGDGVGFHYEETFVGCPKLKTIIAGNIENYYWGGFFRDCPDLESIVLGDGWSSIIEASLFKNHTNLKTVIIGDGISQIGESAFEGCTNLTTVLIGNANGAAENDELLKKISSPTVAIGNGVKTIGDNAFKDCTNLELVRIGLGNDATDNSIGGGVFNGCTSIKSVVMADGCTNLGKSVDSYGVFEGCTNLEEVILPQGITAISISAFRDCGKLTRIEIPEGVTRIDGTAFCDCINLKEVILPSTFEYIYRYAFSGCANLKFIDLPDSVYEIYDYAFQNCTALESIELPKGLRSLGHAFYGCKNLKRIRIPADITGIHTNVFSGLSSELVLYYDWNGATDAWNGGAYVDPVDKLLSQYYASVPRKKYSEWPGEEKPETPENPIEPTSPAEVSRIVYTYNLKGTTYYTAELIKDCNGVKASTGSGSTYFFMDADFNAVTDPEILTQLWTMFRYVENKQMIMRSFNTMRGNASVFGKEALHFLDMQQINRSFGTAVGNVVGLFASGGTSGIKEALEFVVEKVADAATDADTVSTFLQMQLISQQLENLYDVSYAGLYWPVLTEDSAYDYEKILQLLDVYKYTAVSYETVQEICMSIVKDILEKYENDWEVACDNLFISFTSAAGAAVPQLKVLMSVFNSMKNGTLSTHDLSGLFSGLMGAFDGFEVLGYAVGYFDGAMSAFETLYGVSAEDVDEQYNISENYFLTEEEICAMPVYQDYLLLAQ